MTGGHGIARRIDGDTVTYDDPVEHKAVQSLFFHEFHVIDFDNWIEGRVWESPDVLRKVMLARAEMLACMGRPETIDKGLALASSMRAMMYREFAVAARPLVIKGKEAIEKKALRRSRGAKRMNRPDGAYEADRATVKKNPLMSAEDVAKLAGCSVRTVYRIREALRG